MRPWRSIVNFSVWKNDTQIKCIYCCIIYLNKYENKCRRNWGDVSVSKSLWVGSHWNNLKYNYTWKYSPILKSFVRFCWGFFSTPQSTCLDDKPRQVAELKFPDRLPGELYNADVQCKWQFGSRAKLCSYDFGKVGFFLSSKMITPNCIFREVTVFIVCHKTIWSYFSFFK